MLYKRSILLVKVLVLLTLLIVWNFGEEQETRGVHLPGWLMDPRLAKGKTFGRDFSNEIESPKGSFLLIVGSEVDDYDGRQSISATVSICDDQGIELFKDSETYATWFPLSIYWYNENAVLVVSGDSPEYAILNFEDRWEKRMVEDLEVLEGKNTEEIYHLTRSMIPQNNQEVFRSLFEKE